MTPATTQSTRAAFAALTLEERLRRTCGGCGLAPIDPSGTCPHCGATKDAWTWGEDEERARKMGEVLP